MENMVALSLVAVYSAMGVYTISFILFTFDLAKRSAAEPTSAAVVEVTSARRRRIPRRQAPPGTSAPRSPSRFLAGCSTLGPPSCGASLRGVFRGSTCSSSA